MAKRKVNSDKQSKVSMPMLVIKKPVNHTFKVLKADTRNANFRIYPFDIIKRIEENASLTKLQVHTDAITGGASDEYEGLTHIVIGLTKSAKINKNKVLIVSVELDGDYLKKQKINLKHYTLLPVGVGAVKNQELCKYDFQGFHLCPISESAFHKNGKLITK